MVVLVTGATGQLGQALKSISGDYPAINFYFADSVEGNITDKGLLDDLFAKVSPTFCINAAAYTAVDKAESEPDKAYLINVFGAANLAEVCRKFDTTLIHISTDFVFDGSKMSPYLEEDKTNPQGVYGTTKREGELSIATLHRKHFIVRTSWLYSEFGANFMKTMLKLGKERDSLSVVNDQTGTPTHAVDLSHALVKILKSDSEHFGVYHFSNEGETTWYGFAKKIFEINDIDIDLSPITTDQYPTPAKRPKFSVLDKTKIKRTFGISIRNWDQAIEKYRY